MADIKTNYVWSLSHREHNDQRCQGRFRCLCANAEVDGGSSVKSVQAHLPNRAPVLPPNGGGVEWQSENAAVREPCQI